MKRRSVFEQLLKNFDQLLNRSDKLRGDNMENWKSIWGKSELGIEYDTVFNIKIEPQNIKDHQNNDYRFNVFIYKNCTDTIL